MYNTAIVINISNLLDDFIVAGTDTASTTLAWAMVILCNHPKEQSQLQAEMDKFIQEHKRLPKFEERDHFPLLNSLQKECMRMRPISPLGLPRRVVKDSKSLNVMG